MDTGLFWSRVKLLIKAHKTNQAKFAEYIGVNQSTFRGWIYHDRIPDIEIALYIAAALGVSPEFLVFGEDVKNEEIRAQQVKERKTAAFRIRKLNNEIRKELERIG